MKKNTIKLNESHLRNIIKESIKNVLNENEDKNLSALKSLLSKAFSNLSDNERTFLHDMFNERAWDVVYTALNELNAYLPSGWPK